jgi:hypothetical protein
MGSLPALGVAVAATINGDVNVETDLFLTVALAFGQAKNLPAPREPKSALRAAFNRIDMGVVAWTSLWKTSPPDLASLPVSFEARNRGVIRLTISAGDVR